MSKEILMLIDALSNVKGLSKETVFQAAEEGIKEALMITLRKKHGVDIQVEVTIDRKTGDYSVMQVWEKEGEILRQPPESMDEFARIISRSAKQSIMKKIREAETSRTADVFRQRIGELLSGTVQRVTRDYVTIDLGNSVEGIFLREEMLPREAVRTGDRLRGYLYEVRSDVRGAQLLFSRVRPEMLKELFRIEVPEIAEQLIEIKAVARDPGMRAKIAVKTNDGRIDPVGACVGMRGTRVQAVSNELHGERVDIILWDDNPAQLMINAISPAEVSSIVVDEDSYTIDVAVEQDQLSPAIGKNGQNVKLASLLTGWNINIMTKEEAQIKHRVEIQALISLFVQELGVEEELAGILVEQGFTTIEEIAYVPSEELLSIEGFDEEVVEALRLRAKDVMLTKAIANEERLSGPEPAADLLALKGMTKTTACELAHHGVITREDLAEQAVSDLLEMTKNLDATKAAELIMTARAPWFESADK